VHCGDVVTGHVGSTTRKVYAVVGEVVDIARSLGGLPAARGAVLVTEAVREWAPNAAEYRNIDHPVPSAEGTELDVFAV